MAGICNACGVALAPGAKFCGGCGHRNDDPEPIFQPVDPEPEPANPPIPAPTNPPANPRGNPPANPPGSPPGNPPRPAPGPARGRRLPPWQSSDLHLAHGEVVKRSYRIADVHKSWGELQADLVLTDARVIYRSHAKNILNQSVVTREIQVRDIAGLTLLTRRGMSPGGFTTLLLGSLFGLVLALLLGMLLRFLLPILVLLWAVLLVVLIVIKMRRTLCMLTIQSRDVGASPISFAGGTGLDVAGRIVSLFASPVFTVLENLGVLDAADAADSADLDQTQEMYDELGPLILDLQSRGVLGSGGQ